MPDPDHLFTACPLMSPDGARLACEGFGEDRFENPTDPSLNGIYTIRTSDGGGLTRMTSNPGGDDMPGDYSPNGKRLVFARFDENEDPVGLYVDQDRTAPVCDRSRLRGRSSPPAATGRRRATTIVFSRRVSPTRASSLWVVHADGSGLHEIHVEGQPACGRPISDPSSRSCFNPRWSPDGTKIVFSIFSDATGENVYTVNADGTGLTQVTHGGDDEAPDWGTHPLAR